MIRVDLIILLTVSISLSAYGWDDEYNDPELMGIAPSLLKPPVVDTYDYYNRGIQEFQSENYTLSLQHFLEAYRLDPKMHRSLFWIGRALEELGRHQEAAFYYQEMIRAKSESVEDVNKSPLPYLPEEGHASDRIHELEVKESRAEELFDEGNMLLKEGQWRDAAARFGLAAQLVPFKHQYHEARGKALYDAGLYEMASISLKQALNIQPENLETLTVLASIYEKTLNTKALQEVYRQILTINPDDGEVTNRWYELDRENNKTPGKFSIVRRDGDSVYIDGGLNNGLRMGMEFKARFVVFKQGEQLEALSIPAPLGRMEEHKVGEILLTRLGEDMAVGRIVREYAEGISAGDSIRFK